MKTSIKMFLTAIVFAGSGVVAFAQNTVVGGEPMYPAKDIVDNAVKSKDHTTLVAAVKAAGLVETLKTKGPFTVFAPVNAAFSALPAGTVDMLLKSLKTRQNSTAVLTLTKLLPEIMILML